MLGAAWCRRHMSTWRSLAAALRGRSSAPYASPAPLKFPPVYHGKERQDTFQWLQEWPENPAVEAYLRKEQNYVDAYMANTKKFQHVLYEDMARHVECKEESVPEVVDSYMYFTKTEQGESLPVYYRQPVDPAGAPVGPEQVVLNQKELLKRYPYVCVGTVKLSADHSLMAYTIDTTGDETYSAVIAECRDGQFHEVQQIPDVVNVELCSDNATVLYTAPDEHGRPARVYRQRIGGGSPSLILEDSDPRFYLDVSRTKDKRWITINANSKLTSEVRVLDAWRPWGEPRLVKARSPGTEYFVDHSGDHFFIVTNAGGALNYKVVKAPDSDPRPCNWVDYHVPTNGTVIQDMDVFKEHCAIYERDNHGLPQVTILGNHGDAHRLPLAKALCHVQPGANATYTATKIRLSLSGPLNPELTLDYDMNTRTMQTLRQTALDYVNADDYVVRQVLASSAGVEVPITLIHERGIKLDGRSPMLVHGYGQNLEADFHAERLALFTRGWVYALCHVRGGMERGKPWHEDGRLMHKHNSFADWAACIRTLHASGYSAPALTAARGASAGGLLTAAGCMLHPGLVKSAILRVPFVDVLTAMLDETLHLTVHEYDEWGNPRDNPEVYDYIASYCPYTLAEKINIQAMPHILTIASMRDTRVPYWQPAKLTARLRERRLALSKAPELFLSTDWDGGHFGSGGRLAYLRDYAYEYAFLHKTMGLIG